MNSIDSSGAHVGQVLDILTDKALAIWLVDHNCRMHAWNIRTSDFKLGDLVVCRVDADGNWIDKVRHAGHSTREAYNSKIFRMLELKPLSVYVGEVLENLTDTWATVWFLDGEGGHMAAQGNALRFPPGTMVFARVAKCGSYFDKLLQVGPATKAAYAHKSLLKP